MNSKTLATTSIVPYSVEAIYNAFQDPDLLAQWWGPNGFTNTFSEFQFTPGGKWTHVMRAPDGTEYPNVAVFRETNPGHIVIEHTADPHFTLTVMFMAREGGTHIFWIQEFDSPEIADKLSSICVPGNEQNLDRLTAVLAANS